MLIKYFITTLAAAVLFWTAVPTLVAATVRVENDVYVVSVDPVDGSFSVTHKPSGKIFLTDGKLSDKGGTAKIAESTDKTFGKGRALRLPMPTATATS